MNGATERLHELAKCLNETSSEGYVSGDFGSAQSPEERSRTISEIKKSWPLSGAETTDSYTNLAKIKMDE